MVSLVTMAGSSIAGRDAAPWVTDFLNAAYYRREGASYDDLRLAFSVLTTYWWRKDPGRRLHVNDLPAFHRAFGADRLASRGRLDRAQLEAGAATLLGDWFPAAYADDERRGWGIAFPSVEERNAYDPGRRLALSALGELTPERSPDAIWHTYPAVAVPAHALEKLLRPETWPDYGTPTGRFTPLRPGGLDGQTFEIEVAAPGPVFTRGYVTASVSQDTAGWFAAVSEGLEAHGEPGLGADVEPVAGIDLTTHAGHFMGAGHNRVLVYERDGGTWAQAAGTWDPMPWHLDRAYALAGRDAQAAFWGGEGMFAQL